MAEIARQQYPMLPIGLLRYPLETFREVARLGQQMSEGRGEGRGQLLLVHGERDALIPLSHSQRLQALAPGSQLVVIAGAGHGDLQDFPAYQNALADAIAGKDNGSSADSAADPGNDAGSADLSAGKPSTARRRSPGT
jgi:pimeloyl-ACP methyl ester carboxylesterase